LAAACQPGGALTYNGGIADILETRCTGCHQDGQIAPFPLTSYEEAYALRSAIAHSVETDSMPPWMADNSCNDYSDDYSLQGGEKAALLAWVEAGAPEGPPAPPRQPSSEPQPPELSYDLSLTMAEPYTPQAQPDDYRCFVLEWPAETEQYVTGYQVRPGREDQVHHVISFVIDPHSVEQYRAMDAADSGYGYSCFGSPNVTANNLEASLSWRWLGSWTPGLRQRALPEGSGIRVSPGSAIVMQVHYNSDSVDPTGDQTSFDVRLSDAVQRPAVMLPFTHYDWVVGNEEMHIPAGDPDVVLTASRDLSARVLEFIGGEAGLGEGDSFQVHSAGVHMHLLGTRARLWLERSSAQQECLLQIPEWDFGWQGSVDLVTPITIHEGDVLHLECAWDNSAQNQPVVDGQQLEPQDVGWGDGTDDEMCLAILFVTAVPGS
jgi:hypothetical protein